MASEKPFWESIPLRDMSRAQWESLCDGCARCCLHKLEDAYTGRIYYTSVACELLDRRSCRCGDYDNRKTKIPDCIVLTEEHLGALSWLPESCAYRRLDEGRPLASWHPLLSGDPDSVHTAGISARDRCVSEVDVHEDDFENFIINWIPSSRNPERQ
jgi:uncharacterized cysteine cluster protein YcgN (CxxCxxCC family)